MPGRIPASEFAKRMPPWLKKRICAGAAPATAGIVAKYGLNTVCVEAACPNRGECYADGTATFIILGKVCSRNCAFCNVTHAEPAPPDPAEPEKVARAAAEMKLDYCVVTSVTRDDLPDGGSALFAETIRQLHDRTGCLVEVLTPDFEGRAADIDRVIAAGPEVFNHNVETVPRLYPAIRPQAEYRRSLALLKQVSGAGMTAKSGLMVGVGETDDELFEVFDDLLTAGCSLLTIGQYLRPGRENVAVHEFVTPEHFDFLADKARSMGFSGVASGPFVRSSHKAKELYSAASRAPVNSATGMLGLDGHSTLDTGRLQESE